jgi:UDP-N-acetylglucosamine 2-epimerase (non-hydrolysing)
MTKKTISLVVGARPNFMKIAPILRELDKASNEFAYRLIHTGQHNSSEMNEVFFSELGIPEPDVYLNGSGGTHAEQTARIMIDFEADCVNFKPDIVLVVGDVNSTLACAIVSKKLCIKLVHVEAGLRSGDHEMPEEINRMVTDSITDLFFVTEPSGVENLLHEGHNKAMIHYVGNVMIDNLIYQLTKLNTMDSSKFITNKLKNTIVKFGVVTLHRPSNVDNLEKLSQIIKALNQISNKLPIIFPVHPRTKLNLDKLDFELNPNIFITPSLPFMEFLNLWRDAEVVITDSGGLQEETTALGVPCITLRENTERPITVEKGTNRLVGTKYKNIIENVDDVLSQSFSNENVPKYWDGKASKRIIKVLLED